MSCVCSSVVRSLCLEGKSTLSELECETLHSDRPGTSMHEIIMGVSGNNPAASHEQTDVEDENAHDEAHEEYEGGA